MPETTHNIGRLAYERSTHAPVYEVYQGGSFEPVGDGPEAAKPWRLHGETGAEIHALGGPNHQYSTDLRVGSSYPETVFIFADRAGSSESASHDALEAFLREHDLWSDALDPVAVPNGTGGWRFGFMFRPPERAPYKLGGIAESIRETFGLDSHDLLEHDHAFQAMIG